MVQVACIKFGLDL